MDKISGWLSVGSNSAKCARTLIPFSDALPMSPPPTRCPPSDPRSPFILSNGRILAVRPELLHRLFSRFASNISLEPFFAAKLERTYTLPTAHKKYREYILRRVSHTLSTSAVLLKSTKRRSSCLLNNLAHSPRARSGRTAAVNNAFQSLCRRIKRRVSQGLDNRLPQHYGDLGLRFSSTVLRKPQLRSVIACTCGK